MGQIITLHICSNKNLNIEFSQSLSLSPSCLFSSHCYCCLSIPHSQTRNLEPFLGVLYSSITITNRLSWPFTLRLQSLITPLCWESVMLGPSFWRMFPSFYWENVSTRFKMSVALVKKNCFKMSVALHFQYNFNFFLSILPSINTQKNFSHNFQCNFNFVFFLSILVKVLCLIII